MIYDPDAEVYHSHGIHHDQKTERAYSTIKVLKRIEKFEDKDFLPSTMHPDNIKVSLFLCLLTKNYLTKTGKTYLIYWTNLKR